MIFVVVVALFLSFLFTRGGKTRPNLILLMADDSALSVIGRYTKMNDTYNSVLKDFVDTPHIDSIGEQGVTFTQATVENSICSPGRAAVLTGMFTPKHGVGCTACGASIHPDAPLFPAQLSIDGYETAVIGKWSSDTSPDVMHTFSAVVADQGGYFHPQFFYYENYITGSSPGGARSNSGDLYATKNGEVVSSCVGKTGNSGDSCGYRGTTGSGSTGSYASSVYVDEAIIWLDTKRDKTKPFMLNLWFKAPHSDYEYADEELNLYNTSTIFPVPENFWNHGYQGKTGGGSTFPRNPRGNNPVDNEFAVGSWSLTSKGETTSLDSQDGGDGCSGGDAPGYFSTYSGDSRTDWNRYKHKTASDLGQTIPLKNGQQPCNALQKLRAYQHYVLKMIRCMKSLDTAIGRILDYLKTHKLEDNTVVAYTSDQGYFVGEYGASGKRTILEPTMRTPFMIKFPGVIPAGHVSDIMIQNVDFAPTLLDLIGEPLRGPVGGKSAARVARGLTPGWHTDVQFFGFYSDDPYTHGIRTKNYTYSKTWVFKSGFYFGFNYEYFDNINDPWQKVNLAWQSTPETATGDLRIKMEEAETALQLKMTEIGMTEADVPGMCPGVNSFEGCREDCITGGNYPQCKTGDVVYNGVSLGSCGVCRAKPQGLSYLEYTRRGGSGLKCGDVHDETCANLIRQRRQPLTESTTYKYPRGYKY